MLSVILPFRLQPLPHLHLSLSLHFHHYARLDFGGGGSSPKSYHRLGFCSVMMGNWSQIAKFINFSISVNHVQVFQRICPY